MPCELAPRPPVPQSEPLPRTSYPLPTHRPTHIAGDRKPELRYATRRATLSTTALYAGLPPLTTFRSLLRKCSGESRISSSIDEVMYCFRSVLFQEYIQGLNTHPNTNAYADGDLSAVQRSLQRHMTGFPPPAARRPEQGCLFKPAT